MLRLQADADTMRRCSNAFEAISGGQATVSASAARESLLTDEHVRSLCFPATSTHARSLDNALRRMATSMDETPTVEVGEFSALFAALTACACAPASAAGGTRGGDEDTVLLAAQSPFLSTGPDTGGSRPGPWGDGSHKRPRDTAPSSLGAAMSRGPLVVSATSRPKA